MQKLSGHNNLWTRSLEQKPANVIAMSIDNCKPSQDTLVCGGTSFEGRYSGQHGG